VAAKSRRKKAEVVGILGVGLDDQDEHRRITRAEDVLLVGGSQETHERMQDVAITFNEALKERGKRLAEAEPHEVFDLLCRALER
jgi:hypothetical protein